MTLGLGVVGGSLADMVGAPLPWLLGGMAATGALAVSGAQPFGLTAAFPMTARLVCVPIIGVLIGSAFTPDVLGAMPGWWPGLLAVALFVPLAHAANYALFRKVGRLDHGTAFFAAMPGGLIEAIELARGSAAHIPTVTVLQFARIAVVVTTVPLVFAAVEGRAVGSAAGESMGGAGWLTPFDAAILIACAVVGFFGARAIRMPAGQILGPMIATAVAHGTGLTAAAPPALVVSIAQLVIGITLGLRFQGLGSRDLLRFFGLSALSIAMMMALGVLLALPVIWAGSATMALMVLSLAPGGVVEMGLIALSLQASPIFVTAHHLVRIVLTVTVAVAGWRHFGTRA